MTSDAIEQRLSLFQRRLKSERSNSEDSLHHRFHLLRGRLRLITKVSESLFCRHLEIEASLKNCIQCRYPPGWASTLPVLCTIAWPCMLNILPACVPVGLTPRCCCCWPVSLLTHQRGLSVVIGSAPGDSAALNATVTLMLPNVRGCLVALMYTWCLCDSNVHYSRRGHAHGECPRQTWCWLKKLESGTVGVCVYFHIKVKFDVRLCPNLFRNIFLQPRVLLQYSGDCVSADKGFKIIR